MFLSSVKPSPSSNSLIVIVLPVKPILIVAVSCAAIVFVFESTSALTVVSLVKLVKVPEYKLASAALPRTATLSEALTVNLSPEVNDVTAKFAPAALIEIFAKSSAMVAVTLSTVIEDNFLPLLLSAVKV